MNEVITYRDLPAVLRQFGFIAKPVDATHTAFHEVSSDAFFVLPTDQASKPVRPSHLALIRHTIIENGIAERSELDAALLNESLVA